MLRRVPVLLVVALGLVLVGCHSSRERVGARQRAAAALHDAELQAEAAHARAALFDCGNRYREASEWGAYCRRQLREIADAERLAGQLGMAPPPGG